MRPSLFLRTVRYSLFLSGLILSLGVHAQLLQLPSTTNLKNSAGRRLGVTDIEVHWNAPGVKGREGKIWGTDIAPYGFTVLGFGSDVASPWRAGADENTTIHFSTDVQVNGKTLAAGTYGFFIALYPDSSVLIFNRNTQGWGSYFYDASMDVLRVSTRQQKDLVQSTEWLSYQFEKQTPSSVELVLYWEKWRIPFTVSVDLVQTTLASIRAQMSGAMGFDPPSLEAAAAWCLRNNVNTEQALHWINSATSPSLGGVQSFSALSVKSGLVAKLGRQKEADSLMAMALDKATVLELHNYGRQLIAQQKPKEALAVFQKNYQRNKGAWPTQAGLIRGYSAVGDYKKALEHARLALAQAPDETNRRFIEQAIKKLSEGQPL